ncbi:MAG TPA: tRNA preQ1(34) S-adenosylmethionine ribosyltransferase-isomerase QueA [Pyrinomonadaceae bacterium]|nr:tRNA preQ1(34) S-adenosylmethionine ribosyltransferase-isomerase QueA [Pyrinomonadaceae bacterium]
MQLSDFDYQLPDDLIAQEPASERSASRMLRVERSSKTLHDGAFAGLPTRLNKGDVLVLNNTRVFPARLFGTSDTGAGVEIFLVKTIEGPVWEALARPARRLKAGKQVRFADDLTGSIIENRGDGTVNIRFEFEGSFDEILERVGKTPLPPYIKRPSAGLDEDRRRYQTVYAKTSGAIAAPTAGLHFTDPVLEEIKAKGVEVVEITLHVGYGTFEPVRAEDLAQHSVLPERFEIGERAATTLNAAKVDRRRIVAVGTTTTRALETALAKHDKFIAEPQLADLTITPGYRFNAIGALLTNFHLPQSSLLILVSTFGGHELIMDAYRHAVRERYRFYSYGDCMFIE